MKMMFLLSISLHFTSANFYKRKQKYVQQRSKHLYLNLYYYLVSLPEPQSYGIQIKNV